MESEYRCLVVSQADTGTIKRGIEHRKFELADSSLVTIRVRYSSLNYKDALAATGNRGVARQLPLVPGIDAAGEIIDAGKTRFRAGEQVMVFHSAFGTAQNGGYSQIIQVPEDWVYRIPTGINCRTAMIYGTAGFTAAQSVDQLLNHQVHPDSGPVIVTGATGGVGIFAVQVLSKLGYEIFAVSGKADQYERLRQLGAAQILDRGAILDDSPKPLLPARWAGGIDTVGGDMLASVLRSTRPGGCITACGLVGGTDLVLTVYPFILRGIALKGIDSAGIGYVERERIWNRLANEWNLDDLDQITQEVDVDGLDAQIDKILNGRIAGRVLVSLD